MAIHSNCSGAIKDCLTLSSSMENVWIGVFSIDALSRGVNEIKLLSGGHHNFW